MPNLEPGANGVFRDTKTLREHIAANIKSAQEQLLRFSKLEQTIPSHCLDMTEDQVWEKYGFFIHF